MGVTWGQDYNPSLFLLAHIFKIVFLHQSHETIYRSLFIQALGVLKKELQKHLRSGKVIRQAKAASGKKQSRGTIKGAISIHDRPAVIEDRAVPRHWEGDLITGSKNTHIATLVERHSRYTMLVKVRYGQCCIGYNRTNESITFRTKKDVNMG
ncbi:hypothetical protein COB64_01090 [Candidatus Wolfebacteria bacterium]|nr:MAG: hypothetical protein COB64_01090 [Candidatus Wolfebacteria bacterium]